MSIFHPQNVPCPKCAEPVEFKVVYSVNGDRRPDLIQEILDRTFQRETCAKCQATFRMEPEFSMLDLHRKMWMLVQPIGKLPDWPTLERQALDTFNRAYGPETPPASQEMGRDLTVRITFGWAAVREKILAADHGLDDAVLELAKTAMIRGLENPPLADDVELRLVDVTNEGESPELVFAWIKPEQEAMLQLLRVPQSFYDDIAADGVTWQPLRAELTAGPFVDVHRLLISVDA